jgi:hypothetical protein
MIRKYACRDHRGNFLAPQSEHRALIGAAALGQED